MPRPPLEFFFGATVVLPGDALLEIALWRAGPHALRYRLCYRRGGVSLVSYDNARHGRALRQLRGRARPYAFRSIEQLRYDFERDIEVVKVLA